jgi:peptidoglycan-associated lipoprotein
MKNLAIYLGLAVLAAACSSEPTKNVAPVTDRGSANPPSTSNGTGSTTQPADNANVQGNPLRDPGSILSKRSVYFDFDSNVVKDEFRGMVQAHARYVADHRDARVRIEGNCDERGSREYNLALGQRRAEAVRRALALLGVADNQMEAVSFGKEKPAVQGNGEEAWAKNRRVEIVYR